MRKPKLLALLGLTIVALTNASFADEEFEAVRDFSFLDHLDWQPKPWVPEASEELDGEAGRLEIDLAPFYEEFARDGHVSIYVGYGNEGYYRERGEQIFEMLKVLAKHAGTRLTGWSRIENPEGTSIAFRDSETGLSYSVTVGGERNAYVNAFATHEVVMYHGHSRQGRGPAFGEFQNYFRMGKEYEVVEVDTRNPYFRNEPIQLTNKYPLKKMHWGGVTWNYQYRGAKYESSHLARKSYTKIIPGLDTDLVNTKYLPGRQIFYFYSCKNKNYWREPLRNLFPDPGQKAVFGTFKDGLGSTKPEALMIMSVVKQVKKSRNVVATLNAAGECSDCFTSY